MDIFDGNTRIRKPYGQNVGDIWAMGGDIGERLRREKNLLGIWEVFRNKETGEPEERMYSVELSNPDPDIQAIIKRAQAGVDLKIQAEAEMN